MPGTNKPDRTAVLTALKGLRQNIESLAKVLNTQASVDRGFFSRPPRSLSLSSLYGKQKDIMTLQTKAGQLNGQLKELTEQLKTGKLEEHSIGAEITNKFVTLAKKVEAFEKDFHSKKSIARTTKKGQEQSDTYKDIEEKLIDVKRGMADVCKAEANVTDMGTTLLDKKAAELDPSYDTSENQTPKPW